MKIRGGAESGSLLLSWRGSEDGASDPLASPRQPGNRRRLGTIDGRRIAAPQRVFVETNPLGRASAKNHPANATVPEEKRFRHAIRGRMVGPEGVKKFGQIGSPHLSHLGPRTSHPFPPQIYPEPAAFGWLSGRGKLNAAIRDLQLAGKKAFVRVHGAV
jgi:hypothetical protein